MVTPESYLALRSWIADHGGGFHPDIRFIQGSTTFVLLPEREFSARPGVLWLIKKIDRFFRVARYHDG
jgi:hypothetical protein